MAIEDSFDTPSGATIGTFDGVHSGHRLVVETLKTLCKNRNLQPVVITFSPHPLAVIAPQRAPALLEEDAERKARLQKMGVKVIMLEFTEELRALTVEEWLELLRKRFNIRLIVVGYDNTFGSNGTEMSIADYRNIGNQYGLEIESAPEMTGVSSTRIRQALAKGDIQGATKLLGYPYTLSGITTHGRGDGRKIGFPTANINVSPNRLLPASGVYAAEATLPSGESCTAVVNVGNSPTIATGLPLTVEAHLINFKGDLYGKEIRLTFLNRIRDERKFPSIGELKKAISKDIETALKSSTGK